MQVGLSVRSGFLCVLNVRFGCSCAMCVCFDDESTLSTVFLVLSSRSTTSPTAAAAVATAAAAGTPTRPGPESPLSERTLDCIKEIPSTEGSKWPLEPLRVVPTVRGLTDPEIPSPPPTETDLGPASSVATDGSPLAAVSNDLTENSVVPTAGETSSGSTRLPWTY